MNVLIGYGIVLFVYTVAWFITRRFYRKHQTGIENAVASGAARPIHVIEESIWFAKSTAWLAVLALIAVMLISFGASIVWLLAYIVASLVGFTVVASCSESLLRSEVRREEYEDVG